jgi:hypothetical protein
VDLRADRTYARRCSRSCSRLDIQADR